MFSCHNIYCMGVGTPVQLISDTERCQMKADSCEWATPPPRLASNSLTTVMPINLMTLWLFWIFISPCWTPSICYTMLLLLALGRRFFFYLFFFTQQRLLVRSNSRPSSSASPPPPPPLSFLLASLCLHCFTLLLGLQVIGNGTDPSWSPPITFVKRERGMESHIRRQVVIIFAMPSARINHSGRLLVECRSQPWMEPAATLFDWQFW